MNKTYRIFFSSILLMWCLATAVSASNSNVQTSRIVLLPDTIGEVEDNPFLTNKDSIKRPPVDSAAKKGFKDYKTFVMDKRDRGINEDPSRHWYDNLFVQLGAGVEQMVPYAKGHGYNPMTTAHGALGVQLGRFTSVRLTAHAGLSYEKYTNRMFARIGGKVDHLFDISSFINGYQTTRLLSVSSVLGVGYQYGRMSNIGLSGNAAEAHGGLQLRLYTGPHGYLNIEPYIGIGTDDIDLNQTYNWRRFDVFYGANINYVYYFTNHLSRQARKAKIDDYNQLFRLLSDSTGRVPTIGGESIANWYHKKDSTLQSWQTPWIFEYAFGVNFTNTNKLNLMETMGNSAHLAIGKWFSPVIGMRLTASSRTAVWRHDLHFSNNVEYKIYQNQQYFSGGVEAMFNPLGGLKKFSWNGPYGIYLLAGGEYGWMKKDDAYKTLHCRSEAYTAGLHLWYRLSDGVQLFLEPRFTHNVYRIPYRNASRNERYSDNSYGLRAGITIQTLDRRYRSSHSNDSAYRHFTVGIGGGTNIVQNLSKLKSNDSGLPYNLQAFASYHIGKVSGIRASFELLSLRASEDTEFIDFNMEADELGYAPYKRNGVWNHNYIMGIISLAYDMNLSNAIGGFNPNRRFDVNAFLGPSIAITFGDKGTLDNKMTLRDGHEARLEEKIDGKTFYGISGGATLTYKATSRLGITLTPQIHLFPLADLPGLTGARPRFFETFDLGVSYKL